MRKAKELRGFIRFPFIQPPNIPIFPKRLDVSPEFWILTPVSLLYAPCPMLCDFLQRTTDNGRQTPQGGK